MRKEFVFDKHTLHYWLYEKSYKLVSKSPPEKTNLCQYARRIAALCCLCPPAGMLIFCVLAALIIAALLCLMVYVPFQALLMLRRLRFEDIHSWDYDAPLLFLRPDMWEDRKLPYLLDTKLRPWLLLGPISLVGIYYFASQPDFFTSFILLATLILYMLGSLALAMAGVAVVIYVVGFIRKNVDDARARRKGPSSLELFHTWIDAKTQGICPLISFSSESSPSRQ